MGRPKRHDDLVLISVWVEQEEWKNFKKEVAKYPSKITASAALRSLIKRVSEGQTVIEIKEIVVPVYKTNREKLAEAKRKKREKERELRVSARVWEGR